MCVYLFRWLGMAWRPGACTNNRYSINEDKFDAKMATVAAHELGHKSVPIYVYLTIVNILLNN